MQQPNLSPPNQPGVTPHAASATSKPNSPYTLDALPRPERRSSCAAIGCGMLFVFGGCLLPLISFFATFVLAALWSENSQPAVQRPSSGSRSPTSGHAVPSVPLVTRPSSDSTHRVLHRPDVLAQSYNCKFAASDEPAVQRHYLNRRSSESQLYAYSRSLMMPGIGMGYLP